MIYQLTQTKPNLPVLNFKTTELNLPRNLSQTEKDAIAKFLKDFYSARAIDIKFLKSTAKNSNHHKIDLRHFYDYDQVVTIREGIYDVETGIELGGKTAIIKQFFNDGTNDIYFVQWTAKTFLTLPDAYLDHLKNTDQNWIGTYIDHGSILPTMRGDDTKDIQTLLIGKFTKSLNENEKAIWEDAIAPIFFTTNNIFTTWEQIFRTIDNHEATITDKNGKHKIVKISPSGFDHIDGLFVLIDEKIIVPFSFIETINDPKFNEIFALYKKWASLACPL